MRELLESILGQSLLRVLGALPRPLAGKLAAALGRLLYWFTPKFRRIADQNLRMAMPELNVLERRTIVRGVYRSLGRLLAECARFPSLNSTNIHEIVTYEGLEHYRAAVECGRGALFLTAHLGPWELGAFAHALYGYPIQILYRPLDNPRLDRLVNRYRTLSGNKLLDKRDSARGILAALTKNETVGILADQNTSLEEGVFVDFFGKAASTTAGIARVALHTGAAVVPAFCVWEEKLGRYVIHFEPALEFTITRDRERDTRAATQQMASVVERYIRRYPDQWLWIHRRWKTRPPGEPGLY
jgi:KDO2-lipid IV(A) lauroyltransferase